MINDGRTWTAGSGKGRDTWVAGAHDGAVGIDLTTVGKYVVSFSLSLNSTVLNEAALHSFLLGGIEE